MVSPKRKVVYILVSLILMACVSALIANRWRTSARYRVALTV